MVKLQAFHVHEILRFEPAKINHNYVATEHYINRPH